MEGTNLCRHLPWDSAFFGRRIARLESSRLNESLVRAALDWCQVQAVDCLYFLADANHDDTVQVAENHAFHLVDIRLTLGLRSGSILDKPGDKDKRIRPCQSADTEALMALARSAHGDSRFFADLHFPRERCAALYETWIAQDCRGSADRVLVAEWEGQVAGYISCHASAGRGQIGLLGVKSEARGRGLGKSLVAEALRWFAGRGTAEVTVVTQARNLAAQQVYQKAGFQTWAVQLWYHRWFTETLASGA